MIHMVGHISNHEAIPTHTSCLHIFPGDKPCVTPRASFASNYVSNQTEKHLTKLREFFVHHKSKKKKILHILHRCHGFGEMLKREVLQEVFFTFGVTLGKSCFRIAGVSK